VVDRSRHHGSRRLENDTRLRGIQQACVTYANGSGSYYPGRASNGSEDASQAPGHMKHGIRVEQRYYILLEESYFTVDFIKSPQDPSPSTLTFDARTTDPSALASYHSYAMLQVPGMGDTSSGERKTEWGDTVNTDAAVLCDRDTGNDPGNSTQSFHSAGKWTGSVAWNDNHVSWEQTQVNGKAVLPTSKYGPEVFLNDEIWSTAAAPGVAGAKVKVEDNCRMVNTGNAP
jgi:hypothetical protein